MDAPGADFRPLFKLIDQAESRAAAQQQQQQTPSKVCLPLKPGKSPTLKCCLSTAHTIMARHRHLASDSAAAYALAAGAGTHCSRLPAGS